MIIFVCTWELTILRRSPCSTGYAANPADGLACMIGGMRFKALRVRAQQELAARFDVREFHAQILKDGAMPMDILEAKMKLWLDASR